MHKDNTIIKKFNLEIYTPTVFQINYTDKRITFIEKLINYNSINNLKEIDLCGSEYDFFKYFYNTEQGYLSLTYSKDERYAEIEILCSENYCDFWSEIIVSEFRPQKVKFKITKLNDPNVEIYESFSLEWDGSTYKKYIDFISIEALSTVIKTQHLLLEKIQTEHQEIVITEHKNLGKTLFLDKILQSCEADLDFYNIGLTEKMMDFFRENKKSELELLIIGGGDGFIVEHLLTNYDRMIKNIKVVELDEQVVLLVNKHFRNGYSCFDNPKVSLEHSFGEVFLKATTLTFDGIIADCTDYESTLPSYGLFTADFYRDVYLKLNNPGYFTQQFQTIDTLIKNKEIVYPELALWKEDYNFIIVYTPSYGASSYMLHISKTI